MRSGHSSPAGVPDVDVAPPLLRPGCSPIDLAFPVAGGSDSVGACRSVHHPQTWRTFGASWFLGGGSGGGSRGARGLSPRLRCGRLAAIAAWAVWWLAFRCSVPVFGYVPCAWPHQGQRWSMLAGVKSLSGFGQTDGGGACGRRQLPEVSVVDAPSLPRAPDENIIFGSDGGGAAVSRPSPRHRLGVRGFVDSQLHLFAISSEGRRLLRSDACCLLLYSTSSRSVCCCCSPLAPMYLALGEWGSEWCGVGCIGFVC